MNQPLVHEHHADTDFSGKGHLVRDRICCEMNAATVVESSSKR